MVCVSDSVMVHDEEKTLGDLQVYHLLHFLQQVQPVAARGSLAPGGQIIIWCPPPPPPASVSRLCLSLPALCYTVTQLPSVADPGGGGGGGGGAAAGVSPPPSMVYIIMQPSISTIDSFFALFIHMHAWYRSAKKRTMCKKTSCILFNLPPSK